jgi:hypothetical protein
VRYAQGGGLTAEGRKRRELVRLAAVESFERRVPAADIAAELRVSERLGAGQALHRVQLLLVSQRSRAVQRWRRAWETGGAPDLASKGQAARCRRGITQVIRVRGGGSASVSVAGLACYRPGHRTRLIWRLHQYRGRKGETRDFTWTEYRDLLTAAHHQLLGGNIVLIWDNLNVHLCAELRAFTGAQPWLRVFQLPSYAPDLNPVEGHLVRPQARAAGQPRLHRPRPPAAGHPAQPAENPAPARPHRRLPRQNRAQP